MAKRKAPPRHRTKLARERAKAAERFLVRLIWILETEGPEAAREAIRKAAKTRGPGRRR